MPVEDNCPIPKLLRFQNTVAHQRSADACPLIFRQNANRAEIQHFDLAVIRCDDPGDAVNDMPSKLSVHLGHEIQLRHKGGQVSQFMDK